MGSSTGSVGIMGSTLAPQPGHQAGQCMRRSSAPVLCDITNMGCLADGNKPGPAVETIKVPHFGDGNSTLPRGVSDGMVAVHQYSLGFAPPRNQSRVASATLDDELMSEDPQNVTEYLGDIFNRLEESEANHMPRPEYMDMQIDINAKMRAILIDWLIEVHLKYKLKSDTLYLAVNIIDRFLAHRQLPRKKLQLCGVTAMLIASKFEEIYPPEVADFVYITDNAYTRNEILQMEVVILTVLKFTVCCPTVSHFLDRYQRQNCRDEAHQHLMHYVLELCLPDLKMIHYPPSHLAAAAALLSNKLLKLHPAWPQSMITITRHTEPMIKACAREMCGLLEAAERSPLQAIRKKYSQPRFGSVATTMF